MGGYQPPLGSPGLDDAEAWIEYRRRELRNLMRETAATRLAARIGGAGGDGIQSSPQLGGAFGSTDRNLPSQATPMRGPQGGLAPAGLSMSGSTAPSQISPGGSPANVRQPAATGPVPRQGVSSASPYSRPYGAGTGVGSPATPIRPDQSYDPDLLELRRQQAAFQQGRRDLDDKYGWMAIPAVAPLGIMFGLEGAEALAARVAAQAVREPPISFAEKEPYLRVGDNWSTRAGRQAHEALRQRLKQKPGWEYEPSSLHEGRTLKPDVGAPLRKPPSQTERFQMELKPIR